MTTLVLVVGACGVVGVVILAIGLKCFVEIVDDKLDVKEGREWRNLKEASVRTGLASAFNLLCDVHKHTTVNHCNLHSFGSRKIPMRYTIWSLLNMTITQ